MRRLVPIVSLTALLAAGWVGLTSVPAGVVAEAPPPPAAAGVSGTLPTTPTTRPAITSSGVTVPDPTVPPRRDPQPEPDALPGGVAELAPYLADARLQGLKVGVSVWIDGPGVVFEHNPDDALFPASNQKLLTAAGALGLLASDFRFRTELVWDGADLVLVAGGDPTLRRADLARLAAMVRESGVGSVPGDLVVDSGRYSDARIAPGWLDWQMPTYVGPLSTFVLDDNRLSTEAAYLADPDLGNAAHLKTALEHAGVVVAGDVIRGSAPPGPEIVAAIESAARDELVGRLLTRSDNEIAEALVREIGYRVRGEGTTTAGLAAITDYVEDQLDVSLVGPSGDGSGLSRASRHSAGEWRELLVAAQGAPWWPVFEAALPSGGETGTLASRLRGPSTRGKVRAKTGSIIGGRSLSGYVLDRAGRIVVFSFVVNGETAGAAVPLIDEFVTALAGLE